MFSRGNRCPETKTRTTTRTRRARTKQTTTKTNNEDNEDYNEDESDGGGDGRRRGRRRRRKRRRRRRRRDMPMASIATADVDGSSFLRLDRCTINYSRALLCSGLLGLLRGEPHTRRPLVEGFGDFGGGMHSQTGSPMCTATVFVSIQFTSAGDIPL